MKALPIIAILALSGCTSAAEHRLERLDNAIAANTQALEAVRAQRLAAEATGNTERAEALSEEEVALEIEAGALAQQQERAEDMAAEEAEALRVFWMSVLGIGYAGFQLVKGVARKAVVA